MPAVAWARASVVEEQEGGMWQVHVSGVEVSDDKSLGWKEGVAASLTLIIIIQPCIWHAIYGRKTHLKIPMGIYDRFLDLFQM